MSNTPPFFDKICKRSARFILACVQSESSFIRSTVRYGIFVGRCNSFIVEMSCFYVHVSNGSLMISSVAMLILIIMSFCIIFYSRVGNDDWSTAQLLAEILRIRDDDFRVLFSDGGRLSTSELNCILSYVASSRS